VHQEEASVDKKGKKAVRGVSFGVSKGECFGLLGVNGAGKSSTFKCLAGDEKISGGITTLNGVNVRYLYQKPWKMHGVLGYCPQYNCIDRNLTVRQTLTLFAGLSGIRKSDVPAFTKAMIIKTGLAAYADVLAGNLSGGNKRKLTLAMALIGRPKVILVDEASTGVDPASRRVMWKAIKDEGKDSAVVVTTHTMEEAEQLCSKIGIMKAGHFMCFGPLFAI